MTPATSAVVTTLARDLPLDLPLSVPVITVLLVLFFILHLVAVNLMLGGAILTAWFQWRGWRQAGYSDLAHTIADTVTVSKSMAVVLGVGPLLAINLLYTNAWYSANALTGRAIIAALLGITAAFLLLYLHKSSWQRLRDFPGLHLGIVITAAMILLAIPLVFLANVTLMQHPHLWAQANRHGGGFMLAVLFAGVIPRWIHVVLASLSLTALFLVWWTARPSVASTISLSGETLKRDLYVIALVTSGLQFLAGPLVLTALPVNGMSWSVLAALIPGVLVAIPACVWMWKEISAGGTGPGKHFWRIVLFLTMTIVAMVTARQLSRHGALAEHQTQLRQNTAIWSIERERANQGLPSLTPQPAEFEPTPSKVPTATSASAQLFRQKCSSCHAESIRKVGPPLSDIRSLYTGKPDLIAAWAAKPGRKRSDYPVMAPVVATPEELLAISQWILSPESTP